MCACIGLFVVTLAPVVETARTVPSPCRSVTKKSLCSTSAPEIGGPDAGDVSSLPSHLDFDANAHVSGLRVGYFPAWMKENPATDVDRKVLETATSLGMMPVQVTLPDWPYSSLMPILFSEAAAAFEDLTLSNKDDSLRVQVPDAWPNLFRQSRFLSAVDTVPGFFIATGFSGHGFGIGPGAGRLVADMVSGAPSIVDPTPFRLSRFTDGSNPRPHPLAS